MPGISSRSRRGLSWAGLVLGLLVVVVAIPFAGVVLFSAAVSEQSAIVMYGGAIAAFAVSVWLGATMITGGRKALTADNPADARQGARSQAIAASVVIGAVLLWVLLALVQTLWMM